MMVLSSVVDEKSGIGIVDEIVKKWDVNECWLYCIDFLEKTDTQLQFRYLSYFFFNSKIRNYCKNT